MELQRRVGDQWLAGAGKGKFAQKNHRYDAFESGSILEAGMKQLIAILGFLALPAMAQEAAMPDVDWEQLRAQATELRSRAKLMRTQADKTQADAERYCQGKLLVAGCIVDARHARREAERAIRRVELEAVEIDRRLRVHEHELKLERRAEKDRQREIKAAERAEEIRRDDEKRRLKNEKRAAEEERRRLKAQRE
jgi:hypothetical protein